MFHQQNAEKSLKYYKGYKGSSKEEEMAFYKEFERLKLIATEQKTEEKLQLSDFRKNFHNFFFQFFHN